MATATGTRTNKAKTLEDHLRILKSDVGLLKTWKAAAGVLVTNMGIAIDGMEIGINLIEKSEIPVIFTKSWEGSRITYQASRQVFEGTSLNRIYDRETADTLAKGDLSCDLISGILKGAQFPDAEKMYINEQHLELTLANGFAADSTRRSMIEHQIESILSVRLMERGYLQPQFKEAQK